MEKSDEKPLMNKLQLNTYAFNVLYPNMGNLSYHILEIFELRIFSEKQI